ncbi:hypothetical protein SHIRM173S_07648 [Streptomyces hirsutus]
MISQVHRSAVSAWRTFGAVQPRVCFISRKVCSRSNLRRNSCHQRSTSAGAAAVAEHHSQTGFGLRPPGRRSTLRRINVPCRMGSSSLAWFSQGPRWVSRGCIRSQAVAVAVP